MKIFDSSSSITPKRRINRHLIIGIGDSENIFSSNWISSWNQFHNHFCEQEPSLADALLLRMTGGEVKVQLTDLDSKWAI